MYIPLHVIIVVVSHLFVYKDSYHVYNNQFSQHRSNTNIHNLGNIWFFDSCKMNMIVGSSNKDDHIEAKWTYSMHYYHYYRHFFYK